MFLEGLKALARDEQTRVILLVSKPPHKDVLRRIGKLAKTIRKPIVTSFVGASTQEDGPSSLEEAALIAVALSQGQPRDEVSTRLVARDEEIRRIARRAAGKRTKNQKYVRGLFSGGTFCAEAQILFKTLLTGVYSNAPVGSAKPLRDSLVSQKHSVIDLGEDEFTVGRPHPMIDYSLRNRRILVEAADSETAVILLDVVLGYGAHPDPAAELSSVVRQASRKVSVVCSVTGTNQDPQNRDRVAPALRKSGAIVMPSNAAACKLAAQIIQCLGKK